MRYLRCMMFEFLVTLVLSMIGSAIVPIIVITYISHKNNQPLHQIINTFLQFVANLNNNNQQNNFNNNNNTNNINNNNNNNSNGSTNYSNSNQKQHQNMNNNSNNNNNNNNIFGMHKNDHGAPLRNPNNKNMHNMNNVNNIMTNINPQITTQRNNNSNNSNNPNLNRNQQHHDRNMNIRGGLSPAISDDPTLLNASQDVANAFSQKNINKSRIPPAPQAIPPSATSQNVNHNQGGLATIPQNLAMHNNNTNNNNNKNNNGFLNIPQFHNNNNHLGRGLPKSGSLPILSVAGGDSNINALQRQKTVAATIARNKRFPLKIPSKIHKNKAQSKNLTGNDLNNNNNNNNSGNINNDFSTTLGMSRIDRFENIARELDTYPVRAFERVTPALYRSYGATGSRKQNGNGLCPPDVEPAQLPVGSDEVTII